MMKSAEERWEVDFSVGLASLNLKNPLLAASGTFGILFDDTFVFRMTDLRRFISIIYY